MEEKEKGKMKGIIIAIIVVVVIVGAGIGGFFAFQASESNKSVGTEWGDIYYAQLEKEQKLENNSIIGRTNEYKVQFLPQEENTPIMTLEYTIDVPENGVEKKESYFGIYYINDDNTVGNVTCSLIGENNDVELLYNKKEGNYKWYLKDEVRYTNYKDIAKLVEAWKLQEKLGGYEKAQENAEYQKLRKEEQISFEKEDMPAEKVEENTTISKFEETFIVPENVPKVETITIQDLDSLKNIKKEVTEAVKKYKTMEELTTEEVKQSVAKKEENIKKRETTIKKAKEEVEEKAKREKNSKLTVGSYTLQYGTYVGNIASYDETGVHYEKSYMKINNDKTISSLDENGRETSREGFTVRNGSIVCSNSGAPLTITGNNKFVLEAGGGVTFTYAGY